MPAVKKSLNALADPRFAPPKQDELIDLLVCRTYRPALERRHSIRFATDQIADLFSYENMLPMQPTFGFHGLANMWRYVNDESMLYIADQFDPSVFSSEHFVRLLVTYSLQCKFAILEQLYAKMRQHVTREATGAAFKRYVNQPHADAIFGLCEQLLARP